MSYWFVYIVEDSLGRLYTGITTNVNRRVSEHNTDKKKASKALWPFRPVILRWWRSEKDKSAAAKAEAQIKKLPRKKKLELIKDIDLEKHHAQDH